MEHFLPIWNTFTHFQWCWNLVLWFIIIPETDLMKIWHFLRFTLALGHAPIYDNLLWPENFENWFSWYRLNHEVHQVGPLFGRAKKAYAQIWNNWNFECYFGHNLAKYQYFSMKLSLSNKQQKCHFLGFFNSQYHFSVRERFQSLWFEISAFQN